MNLLSLLLLANYNSKSARARAYVSCKYAASTMHDFALLSTAQSL
jgi:hypothetical protein